MTQLYVAKVVGVTTDTISRWENNRYPSIKRENAERLAEALEVPIQSLLQEEGEQEPVSQPHPVRRHPLRLHVTIFLGLALLAGGYILLQHQTLPPVHIEAKRVLAPYAAPGTVIPVEVRLGLEPDSGGFILKEHFPAGWKLIEASPPASSLDNEDGTARWIIKPGDKRHLVSYLIRVAPDAVMGSDGGFAGEVIAQSGG
ncbi:MAG TPA: helix-turn-helix transcriptional regulator, partial [Desulfuromonadales bacterium]|nr:helix-turn-helix transcriptional regulator [Desulfuromonadales bacterium]